MNREVTLSVLYFNWIIIVREQMRGKGKRKEISELAIEIT